MTPLPKRKLSRQRQGKRRSSINLERISGTKCPNCGKIKLSHQVCPFCGYYQGKLIVAPKISQKKSENQT